MLLRPDCKSPERPEDRERLTLELVMSSRLFPLKRELPLSIRVSEPPG